MESSASKSRQDTLQNMNHREECVATSAYNNFYTSSIDGLLCSTEIKLDAMNDSFLDIFGHRRI